MDEATYTREREKIPTYGYLRRDFASREGERRRGRERGLKMISRMRELQVRPYRVAATPGLRPFTAGHKGGSVMAPALASGPAPFSVTSFRSHPQVTMQD